MSAPKPELDVSNAICTALGLTLGTDVKPTERGSLEDSGNAAVSIWVAPTGGPAPEDYLDAAHSGSRYTFSLQVLVLGPPDDSDSGRTLARQVRDALHTKAPSATDLAAYRSCRVREADPRFIGPDEARRPMFTLNLDLVRTYLPS